MSNQIELQRLRDAAREAERAERVAERVADAARRAEYEK